MSTATPRVGFYLPEDDGSEPVNVSTDLNDNLEKIDANIGFVPSLDSTPPATPFNGMARYDTDTGRAWFRKGLSWAQLLAAGSTFMSNILMNVGTRIGIGTATPEVPVDIFVGNALTNPTMLKFRQTGDVQSRLQLDQDGIKLGAGGATTPDIHIYRPAPNQLSVTGGTNFENGISVSGPAAVGSIDVSADISLGGIVTTDLHVAGDITSDGLDWIWTKRKTVETSRANSIVLIDDPDFQVMLEANTAYYIELMLFYSGNTTGDFRTAWSIPTNAGGLKFCMGLAASSTNREDSTMRSGIHGFGTEIIYGGYQAGFYNGALEKLTITTADPGLLKFRFAQGTANATDPAVVRVGSLMQVRKVA